MTEPSQLATAGEKEIGRQYKSDNGEINDGLINKEFKEDLKKTTNVFYPEKLRINQPGIYDQGRKNYLYYCF